MCGETLPDKLPGSHLGMLTGAAYGLIANDVRLRAFAELVERLSAFESAFERNLGSASAHAIRQQGIACISPSELQHFSAHQPLPSFLDRNPDVGKRSWCSGVRPTTGAVVLVPALVCFLQWEPPPDETLFAWPGATGLAAGRCLEEAARRALLEVIERDACMLTWRVKTRPVSRLASTPSDALLTSCSYLGLQPEIYGVRVGQLPGVVIAVVSSGGNTKVTCGSAAGGFDTKTIDKALSEALALQWTVRNFASASPQADPPETSFEHVAMAYRAGQDVVSRYRLAAQNTSPQDVSVDKLGFLELASVAEKEFNSPVIVVDVTSNKARCSGWSVCRVIVPGALPRESNAHMAHLGGTRLCAILGENPQEHPAFERAPHPFG